MRIPKISCLYSKHVTIVNYDSNVINKFGASLSDDTRVIIFNCHMFKAQAIGLLFLYLLYLKHYCEKTEKYNLCEVL